MVNYGAVIYRWALRPIVRLQIYRTRLGMHSGKDLFWSRQPGALSRPLHLLSSMCGSLTTPLTPAQSICRFCSRGPTSWRTRGLLGQNADTYYQHLFGYSTTDNG